MQIEAKKVVTLEYTLKNDEGTVIDTATAAAPLEYLHGASNIVTGLETALLGKSEGDTIDVAVPKEQGYGERNEALVRNIAIRKLPDRKAEIGKRFRVDTDSGPLIFTVLSVSGDYAKVDGNHPLSGMNLHFTAKGIGVRDATEEEVAHGHVHDAHGHGH